MDNIDKNLEFKTFIFITLLGGWLYLARTYLAMLPLKKNDVYSFTLVIASYIVFYPMLLLGLMLVYSAMYQIEENEEKIKELKDRYSINSKKFFEWWPSVFIMGPPFILISFLENIYTSIGLVIIFLLVFVIKKIFFGKLMSWTDVKNHYRKFSLPFFAYCFFCIALLILHLYKFITFVSIK
ncbi:MAG: hypothetical protein WAW11_02830 [Patescibacteria group bacterium]